MNLRSPSFRAEALLLLITVIWGGTFVLVKESVTLVPPFLFNAVRFGVALSCMLLLFGRKIAGSTKQERRYGLILGILYGTGFLLQTVGLRLTTVAKSSFITGSAAIIVPFVFWIVERKRATPWQYAAVVIAGCGMWLLTNPDFDNINIGDILTLGSAIVWSFYIVLMDVFTRNSRTDAKTDSLTLALRLTAWQFIATVLLSVIASLLSREVWFVPLQSTILFAFAYTALLASLLATLVQTRFQCDTTPVKTALIFGLEPVVATLLGVIVLKEHFGWRETAGSVLMIAAVLLAELGAMLRSSFVRRAPKHEHHA